MGWCLSLPLHFLVISHISLTIFTFSISYVIYPFSSLKTFWHVFLIMFIINNHKCLFINSKYASFVTLSQVRENSLQGLID